MNPLDRVDNEQPVTKSLALSPITPLNISPNISPITSPIILPTLSPDHDPDDASKKKQRRVAIYVRLSKEDARAGDARIGESVSIENQKLMLTKHVQEMGWHVTAIYQDDGFSGTNQNRPAFQRMLADVAQGLINTILVKDLSRLGRNYLEVGQLAEVFLPEHDCELISLHEKLDDMMVFRNWFNEQHSKSTGAKVRAARRICAESGKFLGTYAPYGYRKDANNRHRLVPDKHTAAIVRHIFQWRAAGMGFRAIAAKLTEDGITPPRAYYYQEKYPGSPNLNANLNVNRDTDRDTNRDTDRDTANPDAPRHPSRGSWSENSVRDIIKNEVYIGNTVQCKTGTISYKNHRQKRKPHTQWIRVEATHEALIEQALWERVQAFTHKKYRPRRRCDGKTNLFAGLLYCADCGFKLRGQLQRNKRRDGSEHRYVFYVCGTYAHKGKTACTAHGINETILLDFVSGPIQTQAAMLTQRAAQITEAVLAARQAEAHSRRDANQKELNAHKKQLAKLDTLIDSLYEDKVNGLIPADLFTRLLQKYEANRRMHVDAMLHATQIGERQFGRGNKADKADESDKADEVDEVDEVDEDNKVVSNDNINSIDTASLCADVLTRYIALHPPDAETLLLAIDKIIVGETRQTNGERICDIRVHYRFTI